MDSPEPLRCELAPARWGLRRAMAGIPSRALAGALLLGALLTGARAGWVPGTAAAMTAPPGAASTIAASPPPPAPPPSRVDDDRLYEQALALATRTHWAPAAPAAPAMRAAALLDAGAVAGAGAAEAPAGESAWPHVDYCGPVLLRAGCSQPRSVLLVRNASDVDLHDVRICPGRLAAQHLQLLQADRTACLQGSIPAHGDLALTVEQRADARSYPKTHALHLLLGLAGWKDGATLLELVAPILRAPGSQLPAHGSEEDDDFAVGVQERRLTLRSKLVVFTYHGPPTSTAVVQSSRLETADGGLQVMGAERAPEVFARHRLPSCSTSDKAKGMRVHSLETGGSCGLVVSGGKADKTPFTTSRTRVGGTLTMSFHLLGRKQRAVIVKSLPLLMQRVVVVGGEFRGAGYVGSYALPVSGMVEIANGQFHEVPSMMLAPTPDIRALGLAPDGAQLYFGGMFRRAAGGAQSALPGPWAFLGVTNFVDSALWTSMTGPDDYVMAIAQSQGRVYVGGRFNLVGQQVHAGVVSLLPGDPLQPSADEQHWIGLGEGAFIGDDATDTEPGVVYAILPTAGDRVLVGGEFDWVREAAPAPGQPPRVLHVPNLAAWDPQAQGWVNFGGPYGLGTVDPYAGTRALAPFEDGLLLGGVFESVGQPYGSQPYVVPAHALAYYSPHPPPGRMCWHMFEPNIQGRVLAVANTEHGIYVGGRMRLPDGGQRVLLRLTYGQGSGLASDLLVATGPAGDDPLSDPAISAIAPLGDTLCVGGRFELLSNGVEAGNLACRNLATNADELAARGVDGPVHALLPIWQMEVGGE